MSEDLTKNCDLYDSNNEDNTCCQHNKCDEDCCCDIDTLRKILGLFKKEDIKVAIATRTANFGEFIFDITGDVIFICNTVDSKPTKFVPLCNVVRFFADVNSLSSEMREELMSQIETLIQSTCNIDRCCCTDGIADTMNGMKLFNFNKNDLLCFKLDANVALTINPNNCFEIDNIVKANSDIVFAIFENNFFIFPTSKIGAIHLDASAS
jgi:hypothetical protein